MSRGFDVATLQISCNHLIHKMRYVGTPKYLGVCKTRVQGSVCVAVVVELPPILRHEDIHATPETGQGRITTLDRDETLRLREKQEFYPVERHVIPRRFQISKILIVLNHTMSILEWEFIVDELHVVQFAGGRHRRAVSIVQIPVVHQSNVHNSVVRVQSLEHGAQLFHAVKVDGDGVAALAIVLVLQNQQRLVSKEKVELEWVLLSFRESHVLLAEMLPVRRRDPLRVVPRLKRKRVLVGNVGGSFDNSSAGQDFMMWGKEVKILGAG